MSRKVILLLFAVQLCLMSIGSHVAATLTSSLNSTNGAITVCPGVPISLTCVHDNNASGVTRWRVTGTSTANCEEAVAHASLMPPDDMCGLFTITMISGTSSPTMFTSTAQTTATEAINGAVVECFSSGLDTSLVGNITINVLSIPTPDLSIEQVSQSVVRANLSVTDTQCVASYQVDATPTSGPVSTSSSTDSTFNVTGLNVCENNYTLSGSVFTADRVQSVLSSPINFAANLSDVNEGITVTINQMDPLIEWTQTLNPLYPTCITEYVVIDQGNQSLTSIVDSDTRSLTAQQLNAAGFPYCISIHPTVTPTTPMGPLTSVMGSSNLYTNLIDPDFPTPMLTFSFPPLNHSENETGIVVLRVYVQTLPESEVPTRNYRYTNLTGSLSSMVNFTRDMFEIALAGADGGHLVNVTVMFARGQCTSSTMASFTVPDRTTSIVMQGPTTDTSHPVTITLPLTPYQPEELLIISTVQPSNGNPMMANFSRPGMQYSMTFDNLMVGTSYTFTVRIVLRANTTVVVVQPAMGLFMTLITPTTTPPPTTMATTTTSTQTPTQPTTAPQGEGCGGGCIAGIIIGFLIVLLIVVVIVAIIPCYWNKKRKPKVSSQEMEQQRTLTTNDGEEVDSMANIPEYPPTPESDKLGPVYEDPDAFKVDPHTEDNLAYGHVQQSAQLKGPIYEDIKPDPHTQGNLAYGHVQFNSF
ncbi:mucin-2-like [Halichondria panicea]|uniref:mucin-2-like n=1 Tax=Halichondria panicea TaxID=6063 RepID=UPI00312B4BC8